MMVIMDLMDEENPRINIAEAKRHFSDLIGRVAYGGEAITITRRGRPMARLVPIADGDREHLCEVKGWLGDDDPFFDAIEEIVRTRGKHKPRAWQAADDTGNE